MIDPTELWEESLACPICHTTEMVYPSGPKDADILLIGEYPGEDEIAKGKPMTGPMGQLLLQEMRRVGIDMRMCRKTNIWMHKPNKNPKCFQYSLEQAIHEAAGRKAILLMGSDVVQTLCGISVGKVCGLSVTSPYLSAPLIMAMYNPAVIFQPGGVVGEIRLALEKLVNRMEAMEHA